MLKQIRRELVWSAKTAVRVTKARLRSRAEAERRFRALYFAEQAVDLDTIRDYKLEKFPESGPLPWLDAPDAREKIEAKLASGEISPEQARLCRAWVRDGFIILQNFFDHAFLDQTWRAYEAAVREGRAALQPEERVPDDPLPSRSLDVHLTVPELHRLLHDERLGAWIRLLFGRKSVPFQTLVSHKGSQQREHSDAIHMTTYPLGYLTAAWIAFEDIHGDSGPVVYYPGSHRLPYLSSLALGIPPGDFRKGGYATYFERYEPAIQKLIAEEELEPAVFLPKKGDVLLWHSNLIHAGSPRKNLSLSRKAVVLHFFAQGAVCYHDLSGTLTPIERLL